ncbi:hypothetical protein GQX73_g8582 [Xylaria multiplex]|uniref:Amidohydrolase-related domain-containing protein n=1 Tax=Xylaria multiplex TaxID=323545 RepID=A0A7C8MKL8_9PEZI|nr:hypothetical protein GQX73_g8582 [Xylaria multiplex]
MSSSNLKVVDVHTHMYPPAYVELLESRKTIPLIRRFASAKDPRYIILPAEAEALDKIASSESEALPANLPGRPITTHYTSLAQKIHFMDTHEIDISVISLANPWLDFVPEMCSTAPGRLFFFATLPLTAPPETLLAAIGHIKGLKYCRGVILGTTGLGKGLDDAALVPVFRALAANKLTIFLHPHYGLPSEVWGPALRRSVFEAVPDLRMLLAHSGGTLPFLAGRIESCIVHDRHLVHEGKVGPRRRTIWQVLKEQIYLDAVIYSDVGLKAAIDASGVDRLMFGTDHPFFPPLNSDEQGEWESMVWNKEAVSKALGADSDGAKAVMGSNAVEVLRLYGEE